MATQLRVFLDEEDERSLVLRLSRDRYEVYPRRIPADWKPFALTPKVFAELPTEDVYLAASDLGATLVDTVKRGPDKGSLRIDEVRSPVLFWERCQVNEEGELVAGQLWAELEITEQTGRRTAQSHAFRARILELVGWMRTTCRRSHPTGFLIGPRTSRRVMAGELVLRENQYRGREIGMR